MAELLASRYELVDRLGVRAVPDPGVDADARSGVAASDAVWRVWDHKAGTYVAAKVMQHASASGMLRFVREASPRLRHRHVVLPTGWAGVGNLVLFTMPLIRGGSVAELVTENGPLPVPWTATLLDQLLDALSAAHAVDVVHGDVRADRLLLEPNGLGAPRLRLAGFGSRATDSDPHDDVSAVGAMTAGLLVGLGGYERAAGAAQLRHAAPLGIPAVFWDLLMQLTDTGLTAEDARSALVATGCLPDDWSTVHEDATVETVDKLPAYPSGWGPRGPIMFAAPGSVPNDPPRSLDDDHAESSGAELADPEAPRAFDPTSGTSPTETAASVSDEDSASMDNVSPRGTSETLDAPGQDGPEHPRPDIDPDTDDRVFEETDEDHDQDEPGTDVSDAPDSGLAALFRDEPPEPAPTTDTVETTGTEAADEYAGSYGPMPELELEAEPRRWLRRPSSLSRLRLPDMSSLRTRLPERLRRRHTAGPPPGPSRSSEPSEPSQPSYSASERAARFPHPRTSEPQTGTHPDLDDAPWDRPVRVAGSSWRAGLRRPALPTPSPRQAETLQTMGIGALLVGGGLVVAAFAVLILA